jgi:hypothetical protein
MNAPERVMDLANTLLEHVGWETEWQCKATTEAANTLLSMQADLTAALARADRAEALLKEAVEALEGWAAIYDNCSISTGYCCCGDAMESHANPMDCGHSPVDQGWYAANQQIESARATLAKIKEAKDNG